MSDGIILNPADSGQIVETTELANGRQLESVRGGTIDDLGTFDPYSDDNPVPITGRDLARIRRMLERAESVLAERAAVAVRLDRWMDSEAPRVGSAPSALCLPVVVASDQKKAATVPLTNPAARVAGALASYGPATAGTLQRVELLAYNEPAVGAQRSIATSNANNAPTGTGAREVAIYYLDSNFQPKVELVVPNGVTAVPTTGNDIKYVERIVVTQAGSLQSNSGLVSLFVNTTGGGGTIAALSGGVVAGSGDSETLIAHHYVPIGVVSRVGYIVGQSTTPGSVYFLLRAKNLVTGVELMVSDLILAPSLTPTAQTMPQNPIVVQGPALIILYAIPSVDSMSVLGAFDYADSAA